jgi:hypothetical protein
MHLFDLEMLIRLIYRVPLPWPLFDIEMLSPMLQGPMLTSSEKRLVISMVT